MGMRDPCGRTISRVLVTTMEVPQHPSTGTLRVPIHSRRRAHPGNPRKRLIWKDPLTVVVKDGTVVSRKKLVGPPPICYPILILGIATLRKDLKIQGTTKPVIAMGPIGMKPSTGGSVITGSVDTTANFVAAVGGNLTSWKARSSIDVTTAVWYPEELRRIAVTRTR